MLLSAARFSSRSEFVRLIRDSRLQELACEAQMGVVRCGMASVIPLQLINILTAQDLDLRVCGLPDINLEYLKVRICGRCNARVYGVFVVMAGGGGFLHRDTQCIRLV